MPALAGAPGAAVAGTQAVLRAEAVDLVRGGKVLLDQVSVTVRAGEHWALLGANGAGKSTLLRLLATYEHPTSGQVDILGCRLGQVDVFTLRPLVGFVTPHHLVHPARTVREIVLTGVTGTLDLAARWAPSDGDLSRAGAAIGLMGLAGLAGTRWQVLSHGERARALIARALMARPHVLLLDEPAAGLDVAGRERLLTSLGDMRERHPALATVLVTHHLEELPASTTHALLLSDGRVLAAGPAASVLTSGAVSACFGCPLTVTRHAGRWTCTASRLARAGTRPPARAGTRAHVRTGSGDACRLAGGGSD